MNDRSERWLNFAHQDLRMAQLAFREGIFTQVCFHAQQCVEKALKAVLVHHGMQSPRTHAITDLMALLPARFEGVIKVEVGNLDAYYLLTRYPDAVPGTFSEGLPGESEAEEALALARHTMANIEDAVAS